MMDLPDSSISSREESETWEGTASVTRKNNDLSEDKTDDMYSTSAARNVTDLYTEISHPDDRNTTGTTAQVISLPDTVLAPLKYDEMMVEDKMNAEIKSDQPLKGDRELQINTPFEFFGVVESNPNTFHAPKEKEKDECGTLSVIIKNSKIEMTNKTVYGDNHSCQSHARNMDEAENFNVGHPDKEITEKSATNNDIVHSTSDKICMDDDSKNSIKDPGSVKEIFVHSFKAMDDVESSSQKVSNGRDMKQSNSQSVCKETVQVKQDTDDIDSSDVGYRNGTIVMYSDNDDDTSSTMFSSSDAGFSDGHVSDEEVVERLNERKKAMSKKIISRTEGEVLPEELPPLEYLTLSPDEGVEMELLGCVSGIVNVLVVVKAKPNSPALFDDTVLFLEGRKPLGLIFETFGTVEQPYYSVRFNSSKDIEERNITFGDQVLFAPKADNLTKYVFVAELRKMKCDDASWEYDNEPPPSHIEYSDDEEERKAKQRLKTKDRDQDERRDGFVSMKKKRRRKPQGQIQDLQGPGLLPGDLNKNPFGNQDQRFNTSSGQWPPKGQSKSRVGYHPNSSAAYQYRHPPPSFSKTWSAPAGFGEKPKWQNQPGLLGGIPPACHTQMGNFGHNMYGSDQFGQFGPTRFCGSSYSNVPPHLTPGYRPHFPNFSVPPPVGTYGGNSVYQQPSVQPNNFVQHPPPQKPESSTFSSFTPSQPSPCVPGHLFSPPPPPPPPPPS